MFEETSLGDYNVIKAKFIEAIKKLPEKEFGQRRQELIDNVNNIIVVGLK